MATVTEKDKEKDDNDDVLGFDPSLKKKKKKKKVTIQGEEEANEVDILAEAVAEVTVREAVKEAEEIDDDLDLSKKKKKKKKPTEEPAAVPVPTPPPTPTPTPAAEEDDGDVDLTKKKKKKKKLEGEEPAKAPEASAPKEKKESKEKNDSKEKNMSDEESTTVAKKKKKAAPVPSAGPKGVESESSDGGEDGDDTPEGLADEMVGDESIVFGDDADIEVSGSARVSRAAKGPLPWAGSDRDYSYEELLSRVMDTLREKNPELSGEKKRFVMKPPQVVKEGSKKTLFINFKDICTTLKRNHEHVYQFILAELGTSGSIDGANRMIIKGRFQPKAIENIIRHYVVEYVTCHSCKSPDTAMSKDNRLLFLECNQCGAKRSVASIKTGYLAQVGKRKKV